MFDRFRTFAWSTLIVAGLAGCTPLWSIKLSPIDGPTSGRITVVDERPADERKFRFVDFAKLSYESYLGDSNTTPDRITLFTARLNVAAPSGTSNAHVVVRKFDILWNTAGSTHPGAAVAGVSYPAAIVVDLAHKASDDFYRRSIEATIDGRLIVAESQANYQPHDFFKAPRGPEADAAAQRCLDEAITKWIVAAFGLTPVS